MQGFESHPVSARLHELPDHVLRALMDSHKVIEDSYLASDDAGDQRTAWHVAFGRLLRAELMARKSGTHAPEGIYQLLQIANRLDNADLSSVLAYLQETRNTAQDGPLKDFAQALGFEISAMIVNTSRQENTSYITYN